MAEFDKNTNPLHFVERRLTILNSLKQEDDLVLRQREWKIKNKTQRVVAPSADKTDFKTDISFTVKTTKDAELLAGTPEYNFIPLDGESRRKKVILKHIWIYWWLTSRTDKVISDVIPSATAYGTGVMYEGLKTVWKDIKVPTKEEDGSITFTQERVLDYDGVYSEYIPWENFFIDGNDIDSASEAIWIKYWDRDDYISEYENNPMYSGVTEENIPKNKYYTIINPNTGDPKKDIETEKIITELRYYNKPRDEFIVLANGVEVLNSMIPFTHKELPFCIFLDYKVDDRFWGMGEYELLEEDELFADALRSLSIDVIKAQMGTTFIEEDIDLDESTFEYGTNTYTRINNVERVKHFAPNISTNSIDNAEIKLDNTIISKTGVNHRAQSLDPSESATKTASKSQAARKRINLNLKLNGYSFFERLARLRLANLKLFHSRGTKEIFIEGGDIDSEGRMQPINGGYGSFTITPEFLDGEYSIIPITESILGSSEERAKASFLEFIQVVAPILGADGKPVISGEKIVEEAAPLWDVDYEKLTGTTPSERSSDDIVGDVFKQNQGIPTDATNPASPDFIPPEQRSGAAAKGLSGAANISDADVLG